MIRILITLAAACGWLYAPVAEARLRVEVISSGESLGSGRLLLFVRKLDAGAAPPPAVDGNAYEPDGLTVVAREIAGIDPGRVFGMDGDDLAFPASLADLPAGAYVAQAALDRNHDYAYSGRGPGDVLSDVVAFQSGPDATPIKLTLTKVVPELGPWQAPWGPLASDEDLVLVKQRVIPFEIESRVLGAFSGRKIPMRGLVVTPLDYDSTRDRLPAVYFTHGFTGGIASLRDNAVGLVRQMQAGKMPRLIWVLLDQSGPMGTHEFADSLNNGPWGTALTGELIPEMERRYRIDARTDARFVMGHSSGGWAALWLQLAYPAVFGGAWATSPDPADFSDFGGIDITTPGAVVKDTAFAKREAVLGAYGGQMTSFEAVWSPRGSNGLPMPLFDRETGLVDRDVALWWKDHWDLTEKIRREWQVNRAVLDGKIHLVVGEDDEFALDDSARRLEAAIAQVDGKASFEYVPGKGHFDLYVQGKENAALRRTIAWEMWKKAHPQ